MIFTHIGDETSYLVSREIKNFSFIPIRINKDNDKISIVSYNAQSNELVFSVNNLEINSNEIVSILIRGGFIRIKTNIFSLPKKRNNYVDEIEYYLAAYNFSMIDFLTWFFESNFKCVGSFGNGNSNKIIDLNIAKKVGLKIPDTYIVTSKDKCNMLLRDAIYISKSIALNFDIFSTKESSTFGYTTRINPELLSLLPETFAPSLVQQKINRKYDLRVFILGDEIIPMAMTNSNKSDEMIEDVRDYNRARMPRISKVKLSKEIEDNLFSFMRIKGLNTTSIDMICSLENEYYFLESNPVGQIGFYSFRSNSYIEYKIAEYLCN